LILCQNQYQHSNLTKEFPDKKIEIIHNPYFPAVPDFKIKTGRSRKYIAWAGIFRKEKNLKLLRDIAAQNPKILFKVAGKEADGTDNETRMIVRDLEKMKNVELAGYLGRMEVLEFLSEAYALLSTSRFEGFPNVFLEAFYAGTPVVAPARIDPDNMVSKNSLGFISKTDEDLSECTAIAASQSLEELARIAQKCRTFVEGKFSVKKKALELVDIFSSHFPDLEKK
jgi:glycosyltransferase involved in cell wall biosynthesis